ncbi:hypothetical protein G9A89_007851 [Geosiphon pyriformis]|nr:hypothetical protein G9A89_007851 [Geosiphon pyriformis]
MTKINHIHLHQPINSGNRKCVSATIVEINIETPIAGSKLQIIISLLVFSISTSDLSAAATSNISTAATNNLSTPTDPNTNPKTKNDSTELEIGDSSPSTNPQFFTNSGTGQPQNPNSQNYLSLLVTPEDASTNNPAFTQKQLLTSNISSATITKDKSLSAIFPFEFEETAAMPLFSGATLEAKPITAMYTDAKVKGKSIKLILDSGSASSIITRQLMDQLGHRVDQAASARIITANGATKTPISKIDNFPFEVNGIVTSIKVLVMEATQYQALVGNDWLFKVNATLDWNTQELQLTYQGQHIRVLAMYGHFKTLLREKLLIELEEEKEKPTWEAYQVLKGKEEETTQTATAYNTYSIPQQFTYCQPKLICVDCGKKLSSMGACYGDDEEYLMATSDWVKKRTPIKATWQRALQRLDSCLHDDDKIWKIATAKIEGTLPEEIRTIKNNPPESIELN